ncbi:Tyrosine recombinase XerC [Candidatus Xenohaliotis californiensis]|uniref:Tyrosine recombinase XerC n=1 Tax=Candidatus Xenohaliotis californiensis TaxID=84677 RepID=A0ABM9N9A4_9RICK|nr:Tyrosine recombinase XerC [Candidatus Xenohaliotis californiensis]
MLKILKKNQLLKFDVKLQNTFDEWLSMLSIKLSDNTIKSYKNDVEFFFLFLMKNNDVISNKTIDSLSITEFRSWLMHLRNSGLIAASRARALSAIRNFFSYCQSTGLITNNITTCVSMPRLPLSLPRVIDESDVIKFIKHLSLMKLEIWIIKRNIAIVLLMYGCGLRISEVLSLKKDSLDINAQSVVVSGKRDKSRLVPLLPKVLVAIDEYISIFPYKKSSNMLFLGKRGKPMQRTYVANFIQNVRIAAGLPDHITPHAFRHSCATHMLNNGADVRIIQDLLGHTSLNSTQIYTKVDYKYKAQQLKKRHPKNC